MPRPLSLSVSSAKMKANKKVGVVSILQKIKKVSK